ncbi:MAG: hypothetical protein ACOYZ7_00920 [Chloroflexota bacterium]
MKDKALLLKNFIRLAGRNSYGTEFKQALDMLSRGQSVFVVGTPGIGKTPFLCDLIDVIERTEGYLGVYFDGETMLALSAMQTYRLLAIGIQEALAASGSEPPMATYQALEGIVRHCAGQGLRVIVCLDHFDSLVANTNLGAEFFSALRSLVMRFGVAFVTVSEKPLYMQVGHIGSLPFLTLFVHLRLGFLEAVALF